MQLLGFSASQTHPLATLDAAREFLSGNAAARFVWADFATDEVTPAPAAWRDTLATLTGAPILDLHLVDATNPAHPSFFDTTNAYDMVIFRKLTFETSRQFAEAEAAQDGGTGESPAPAAPSNDASIRFAVYALRTARTVSTSRRNRVSASGWSVISSRITLMATSRPPGERPR